MVYDILRIYDIYAVSSTPSRNAFDSFLFVGILLIAWGYCFTIPHKAHTVTG